MTSPTPMTLVALVLSLLLSGGAPSAADFSSASADLADFQRLKDAYEDALNNDNIDGLLPYLDKGFRGVMITGDDIRSPAALKAFWERVKRVIRQGRTDGRYRVKLEPDSYSVDGDRASFRGKTNEEVTLGNGKTLKYQSVWSADLKKVDGQWKISGLTSEANTLDKITLAARVVAQHLWSPWDFIKPPKGDPDFDQDGKKWKDR